MENQDVVVAGRAMGELVGHEERRRQIIVVGSEHHGVRDGLTRAWFWQRPFSSQANGQPRSPLLAQVVFPAPPLITRAAPRKFPRIPRRGTNCPLGLRASVKASGIGGNGAPAQRTAPVAVTRLGG